MQVEELIEKLKAFPKNAHITVDGNVICGVVCEKGSVSEGCYNPIFKKGKGKEYAVSFLINVELSNGEVVSSAI